MERIEMFTGEQRRRRFTPQEKAQSKKLISRMPLLPPDDSLSSES